MTGKKRRGPRFRKALAFLITALLLWIAVSYLALPEWWRGHEKKHPALAGAPRVTFTASGIPGDPLNVFVISSEEKLVSALLAAGWLPADPITLKTSARIAESSVFHRPYEEAPISYLYLFGRREDLGFEKPVGKDPRERHHVRFWRASPKDDERPAWFGAATYDRSVGFSHTTGQVTHHIAREIDAERDRLIEDLAKHQSNIRTSYEEGFQSQSGRNGGGDPWQSDGKLGVLDFPD